MARIYLDDSNSYIYQFSVNSAHDHENADVRIDLSLEGSSAASILMSEEEFDSFKYAINGFHISSNGSGDEIVSFE